MRILGTSYQVVSGRVASSSRATSAASEPAGSQACWRFESKIQFSGAESLGSRNRRAGVVLFAWICSLSAVVTLAPLAVAQEECDGAFIADGSCVSEDT